MIRLNGVAGLETIDGVAVLALDSPPVNALGHEVRVGLFAGLERALADDAAKAIVIVCAGRTFFAGADITEFDRPQKRPGLSDILLVIEAARKPVVAAMHGTALGGGLELALACHYRIAVPSTKLGLPEVHLGLLPGAGGTQRTPRLMGIAAALEFMVFGKPMTAAAAKAAGLIDEMANEGALRASAIRYAAAIAGAAAPLKRARDLLPDLNYAEACSLIGDFERKNPALFKSFKAPGQIAKAVAASTSLPFDEGLEREATLFQELLAGPESAAQRHIFFAERPASKMPGLRQDVKPMPITSVAVIGAGTMGRGISTAFLNAGFHVTLIDLDAEALARAIAGISQTIRALAEKGRITPELAEARVASLGSALELGAIREADLIIEAVFERLDLKKSIFAQIDAVAKPDAILASNTSFLDLDAIASATNRPGSVVGLHFFAPANIMRLLEVVRGKKTSDAVLCTAMALGRVLGKVAILSAVCDGFIANRVMERRGEAADRIILEGPMPWDVDRAMTDFGFPMGVFSLLDLVGVDVIGWNRETSAGRTIKEMLCEKGRWGQKRKAGFYDYDGQGRGMPSPEVEALIHDFRLRTGATAKNYDQRQITEELLYPVVNEGAKLLEEDVAQRASDIDIALVTGYGWPACSGGPMFWGDTIGLSVIVAALERRRLHGEAIAVSPLLTRLARDGGSFTRG